MVYSSGYYNPTVLCDAVLCCAMCNLHCIGEDVIHPKDAFLFHIFNINVSRLIPEMSSSSFTDLNSQHNKGPSLFLYQNCDELKESFKSLETPRDIARLLDVSYNKLTYHISILPENKRYKDFLIPKKSGKSRTISAPCTPLKILQRKLSQVLYIGLTH